MIILIEDLVEDAINGSKDFLTVWSIWIFGLWSRLWRRIAWRSDVFSSLRDARRSENNVCRTSWEDVRRGLLPSVKLG